ncbi:MAG TPA: hypothetical protein VMX54_12210 [Vicinamibacteria bacterium]|nr:hypothetical protein [Vicinamibacteria bacterium]
MSDTNEPDEWSLEERRAFRLAVEARRRRQAQASRVVAIVLMLLVAGGVLFRVPPTWWVPAVGAAALLGTVFRLVNWKCPHCGERLPTRRSADVCPGCGAPLE